jgi:hypothetical protein
MSGRVWSWFLELAPVQEAVRGEVRTAVGLVMDESEQAQDKLRERHRTALAGVESELTALRTRTAELAATNADLVGANASLRHEVAELTEATEREASEREEFATRLVREQEAALEQQWHGATIDVFCCQSCWAFWFLSTAPDRLSCMVRGPFGRYDPACTVCAEPLVALPAAKSVVYRKQAEDRVPRPVLDEEARTGTAVANAELAAIAEGLARLPKVASRTVAWVATGLSGVPDLPATVLGDIATRTTKPIPLDGVVAGIRAFIEVGVVRKTATTDLAEATSLELSENLGVEP